MSSCLTSLPRADVSPCELVLYVLVGTITSREENGCNYCRIPICSRKAIPAGVVYGVVESLPVTVAVTVFAMDYNIGMRDLLISQAFSSKDSDLFVICCAYGDETEFCACWWFDVTKGL